MILVGNGQQELIFGDVQIGSSPLAIRKVKRMYSITIGQLLLNYVTCLEQHTFIICLDVSKISYTLLTMSVVEYVPLQLEGNLIVLDHNGR